MKIVKNTVFPRKAGLCLITIGSALISLAQKIGQAEVDEERNLKNPVILSKD